LLYLDHFIDFIINLTKQIIIKKVNIPYLLQCRAEMIDDEILYWLKKSLCSTICIGFESGSQKVLDYLGKGIKVNQMKSIVKKIHKYKMWVVGYFIIGLPKETVNDLKKTTQLIPKLNLDFIQLHYYFEKNPYYKFYPQQNTSPLIKKYYKKIILKYYLSPSFLIKYLHRLMFYDIFDIKSQTSLINIFFKMIVFNKI